MRPLLVGEANPWQDDYESAMYFALHPDPPHASGGRLCFQIMGLTEREYLRAYDRTDLCWPRWSMPAARAKAQQLVEARAAGDVIVMCGAKVAEAFGFRTWEPLRVYSDFDYVWNGIPLGKAPTLIAFPHPSGLNRWWYQAGAIDRAREVLRSAGVLPQLSPSEAAR